VLRPFQPFKEQRGLFSKIVRRLKEVR